MEVTFEHVVRLSGNGGRFDVWPTDGDNRRRRVDIPNDERSEDSAV